MNNEQWQQLEPWLRLFHIPGLGPTRYRQLLDKFGSAESVLLAKPPALAEIISPRLTKAIQAAYSDVFIENAIRKDWEWLTHPNHHIININENQYPPLLKTIFDPPPLLYICGDIDALNACQLAMVGARQPSLQALDNARNMAVGLAEAGIIVTSGLALGIDGASHQGALAGGGQTVAVLAGGVDVIYPQRHKGLAEDIAKQGALVSEFALGTQPRAGHFPRRNRIISGLSVGTLVVEAAVASGSLVTAKFALEQGRDVFAMPGSVNNPKVRGCHALIRDGACLIENLEQMLQEIEGVNSLAQHLNSFQKNDALLPACSEQRTVLDVIGYEACHHDELVLRTGFSSQKISELILSMELEGFVKSEPEGVTRVV